jgi:two-component sensor histidine kinase
LTPQAAQNIGLALHELATNAMKYGALSSPAGRIVIRWDVDDRQMPRKFRLSWQEQGGPPVNPPTHQGFGHRVLSHIAQGSSDTGVGLMFAPEGFAWSFECEEQLMLRH